MRYATSKYGAMIAAWPMPRRRRMGNVTQLPPRSIWSCTGAANQFWVQP